MGVGQAVSPVHCTHAHAAQVVVRVRSERAAAVTEEVKSTMMTAALTIYGCRVLSTFHDPWSQKYAHDPSAGAHERSALFLSVSNFSQEYHTEHTARQGWRALQSKNASTAALVNNCNVQASVTVVNDENRKETRERTVEVGLLNADTAVRPCVPGKSGNSTCTGGIIRRSGTGAGTAGPR